MDSLPSPRVLTASEVKLYDLLIDDPLSDPWAIDDLLDAHDVSRLSASLFHVDQLLEILSPAIVDINAQVQKNPDVSGYSLPSRRGSFEQPRDLRLLKLPPSE